MKTIVFKVLFLTLGITAACQLKKFLYFLSPYRCVDPKISVIPTSIINFVTRTVIGTIWGKFLHVAKEVQNNERIHHMNAIQQQPELYQYIEQRVQQLLLNNGGPDRGSEALPPGSNTKGKEGEDINE